MVNSDSRRYYGWPAYGILLLTVALIVYGSTYPWEFARHRLPASPIWLLLHSWPAAIDRFLIRDVIVNVALYVPLGVFGFLAFAQHGRRWLAGGGPILLGFGLSSTLEMVQLFDRTRTCSLSDVACNTAGAALGVILGRAFQQTLRRVMEDWRPALAASPAGSLFLAGCWLAYLVYPAIPHLSRTALSGKLRYLASGASLSGLDTLADFVGWLVVARLLEGLAGKKATAVMLVLLCLLPLQLVILERRLTLSELLGAGLAVLIWRAFLGAYRGRTMALACLLLVFLIVQGWMPFHVRRPAAPFLWIPFQGALAAPWFFGLLTLLRKCFWYGAALWLWHEAGIRLAAAAGGLVILLGAIEAMQVYLPGRTPESTDAILAMLLAMVLWLLEQHRRHRVPAL